MVLEFPLCCLGWRGSAEEGKEEEHGSEETTVSRGMGLYRAPEAVTATATIQVTAMQPREYQPQTVAEAEQPVIRNPNLFQ